MKIGRYLYPVPSHVFWINVALAYGFLLLFRRALPIVALAPLCIVALFFLFLVVVDFLRRRAVLLAVCRIGFLTVVVTIGIALVLHS